jgi:hypothetical protein
MASKSFKWTEKSDKLLAWIACKTFNPNFYDFEFLKQI